MGTSEILASPCQTDGIAMQSTAKTASATTSAASRLSSSFNNVLLSRKEERERDERQRPQEIEVEPVREHDLEPEQDRGGQGSQLERPLPARDEGNEERECGRATLEDPLDEMEVRQPARVVLAPIPERERGVPVDLRRDRP